MKKYAPQNADQFYIDMLKGFANKFNDSEEYSGKYIKFEIDLLIKRIIYNL